MCFLLPGHFIQKFNLHPAPAEQGWFGDPHPVRSVSGGSRGDSDAARLPSLSSSRQVAGSLRLTLLCCGAGRTPRARGPQCSRSASPAPARSALQAGRSRARIPSACPPARPLARPRPPSQVSAPGSVPHAPRAPRPAPSPCALAHLYPGGRVGHSGGWRTPILAAAPQHPFRLPGAPHTHTLCWAVGCRLCLARESQRSR